MYVCVVIGGFGEKFFLLEFNIVYMYKFNPNESVYKLGIKSCNWASEGSGKCS